MFEAASCLGISRCVRQRLPYPWYPLYRSACCWDWSAGVPRGRPRRRRDPRWCRPGPDGCSGSIPSRDTAPARRSRPKQTLRPRSGVSFPALHVGLLASGYDHGKSAMSISGGLTAIVHSIVVFLGRPLRCSTFGLSALSQQSTVIRDQYALGSPLSFGCAKAFCMTDVMGKLKLMPFGGIGEVNHLAYSVAISGLG
jgi:hypothetical protein